MTRSNTLKPLLLILFLLIAIQYPTMAQKNKKKKVRKNEEIVLKKRPEIREPSIDQLPDKKQKKGSKTLKSKTTKPSTTKGENPFVEKAKKKRFRRERKLDRVPYEDGKAYKPEQPKKSKKILKKHRKSFETKGRTEDRANK